MSIYGTYQFHRHSRINWQRAGELFQLFPPPPLREPLT